MLVTEGMPNSNVLRRHEMLKDSCDVKLDNYPYQLSLSKILLSGFS